MLLFSIIGITTVLFYMVVTFIALDWFWLREVKEMDSMDRLMMLTVFATVMLFVIACSSMFGYIQI